MSVISTILLLVSGEYVFSAVINSEDYYKLDIIHYNDFHSRFEETSLSDAICHTNNTSCLGGFPRLYHHIQSLLREKPDAVLLNAGDSFQGTYWYTLLKWNVTQQFMNLLPHDAHALGNHEFDDGPEGLAPYIQALKAPVLAANMDTSKVPALQGLYKPSIVVERNGRRIGIIGLVTVDTVIFSSPGDVKFTDPGEATRREAETLTKQGVDIIILLSHCGLEVDKQLAHDYGSYIDIIVGGHTHSLLWNGPSPSGEPVAGPYPVFIENADNESQVLIVQASSFTKYMGNLSVYFDNNGHYVKWEGGPIFLNRSIPEDLDIKQQLEPYAKLVHEAERVPVGESLVTLKSEDCSFGECALGNLLLDAMVEYAKEHVNPTLLYLAFIQRVNIRSKIEIGTIPQVNIFDIFPYVDRIEHFELRGDRVRQALEKSVGDAVGLHPFVGAAWFLQVSGLRVTYNVSLPEGSRITSAYIGDKGTTPLEKDKYYHVLAPKFWSYFANGYSMLRQCRRNVQSIGRDQNILAAYIKTHSPLNVKTEGRIVINK